MFLHVYRYLYISWCIITGRGDKTMTENDGRELPDVPRAVHQIGRVSGPPSIKDAIESEEIVLYLDEANDVFSRRMGLVTELWLESMYRRAKRRSESGVGEGELE